MKKIFIHIALFRLVAPVVVGFVVYILILLVFDGISELSENYLNQEVFFSIGLSYLVLESLRFSIVLLEKWMPVKKQLIGMFLLQFVVGILITWGVVAAAIATYFQWVLNYQEYGTEMTAFTIIFILGAILYNMMHVGLSYLKIQNESKLKEEEIKKANLEYQMRAFNNEVKPDFLYQSLETLITLLHTDEIKAENYIEKLSKVYRYILANKNNELVNIKEEMNIVTELIGLLNEKYQHIHLTHNVSEDNILLVPGSLNLIVENLVDQSIISKQMPFSIHCEIEEGEYLSLRIRKTEKLTPTTTTYTDHLQSAYDYFTLKPIIELKAYGEHFVKLPIIRMATDNEVKKLA